MPAQLRDQPRIVIAGLGLATPLGMSAWQTFRALLAGRTIADRAASLDEEVDLVDLVRTLGCIGSVQHTAIDPAVELLEHVARQALEMAQIPAFDVPCIAAASKGAMGAFTDAMHQAVVSEGRSNRVMLTPDACLAVALGSHGYLAHHLCRRLHVRHIQNVVAACASGLTAVHAARCAMLNNPQLRTLLVVACEASLLPMFIHGYRRLGVLPPLTQRGYRGRPLDRRRCGFMLAEQAAAVLLLRVDHSEPLPPDQIELLDTAIACEAYDLVRSRPQMTAMSHIVQRLVQSGPISFLHPHAPGTAEHDARELAVCAAALEKSATGVSDLYACKGALGHGLGTAGLAALVIACLCARTGIRPPMPWLGQPIESPFPISAAGPVRSSTKGCHLVVATGFGGHVAGAVIRP